MRQKSASGSGAGKTAKPGLTIAALRDAKQQAIVQRQAERDRLLGCAAEATLKAYRRAAAMVRRAKKPLKGRRPPVRVVYRSDRDPLPEVQIAVLWELLCNDGGDFRLVRELVSRHVIGVIPPILITFRSYR